MELECKAGMLRGRGGRRVDQGPGPPFAALPQVLHAECWVVKERGNPSTPGVSNPAGKTGGEE